MESEVVGERICVASETSNLAKIRTFIREALKQSGLDEMGRARVALAVDEAVANIIEHGYEPGVRGQIEVVARAEAARFVVLIYDSGKEFDPESIAEVDIEAHVRARRRGGLGIFLMRRIMDEVKYTYEKGRRNELRLVKNYAR